MPAADRVLELLGDVLGRSPANPAIISGLVRERVPEGLYLEYKGGKWLKDADRTQDLRSYVSGFANAEGGVLIIGVVGGDVKGRKKWRLESPPRCPDKAGWEAWFGRVLSAVTIRTRVEVQVVPVEGKKVVVIAVNRAEELIRVYEKPKVVCYLRIGDQTFPIDETLYADLATGRRAKPDLVLEALTVGGSSDSLGFAINVSVTVHNRGLLWVPGVSVAWCGYAPTGTKGATKASASLRREIDLRPTSRSDFQPMVASFHVWRSSVDSPEVKPFELTKFGANIGLPITASSGPWAWYGTVMVLPKNGSPLWAQVAVEGAGDLVIHTSVWALARGTAPIVGWYEGNDVPVSREAFFGAGGPS